MNLSDHFTLAEMIRTNIRAPNSPNDHQIENLVRLCNLVLEPLRLLYIYRLKRTVGAIWNDSGFRTEYVNEKVGGSQDPLSAHCDGRASDLFAVAQKVTVFDVMVALSGNGGAAIPFDKAIYESPGDSTWLHIQIGKPGREPRRMLLQCLKPQTYEPWDPQDPRIIRP